jgi:hypothetical protein
MSDYGEGLVALIARWQSEAMKFYRAMLEEHTMSDAAEIAHRRAQLIDDEVIGLHQQGWTFKAIAVKYGVSPERIRQRYYRGLRRPKSIGEITMAKTLCVDFDGVIHSYSSGWLGADTVPDPPVPGALDFLIMASTWFDVAIYSARSAQPGGIAAMKAALKRWLTGPGDGVGYARMNDAEEFVEKILKWPTAKPAAFLTLDDRVMCFDGTFPKASDLMDFKTWMEK